MNHNSLKTALILSLSCFLIACGGSSGKSSEPSAPDKIDWNEPDKTTQPTPLELALAQGKASLVADGDVFRTGALALIQQKNQTYHSDIQQLLNLNSDNSAKADGSSLTSIDWDNSHDAAQLSAQFGFNTPLLFSNATQNNDDEVVRQLAVIGSEKSTEGVGRYLVMGSNPMRTMKREFDINDQMQTLMNNSISWLSQRTDFDTRPLNVVISHLDQSYYFPDDVATREWLDAQYSLQVQYNAQNVCDGELLASCITADTDVLIISQQGLSDATKIQNMIDQVDAALKANIGILYMHWDGNLTDLGAALFNRLHISYVGDNYWKKAKLKNANPLDRAFDIAPNIAAIQTLLTTLGNKSISFDWSQCDKEDCTKVANYQQAFLDGVGHVRANLRNLEDNQVNIFSKENENTEKYLLEKHLVLLSDSLRQGVTYPMDKTSTPDIDFISAIYSDFANYITRPINPVQKDLGNFSRSDFSSAPRIEKNVELLSKKYFRAAGVYAIPGETVKVTRLDNEALTTKIYISSVRDEATHWYAENGYTRPRHLKSAYLEIKPGESIEFTSSIGGPIQVSFSANDLVTKFKFENVGQHPYWAGSQDDARFSAQLNEGFFDWAEVSTPGFEVHSKVDKMQDSITGWNSAAELAQATERYMHNFPHVLSGFQGPGIDKVAEIHDFADDNNLTVQTIDIVKHMNADQATCGYGCSGNPYDAYWSYSPTGHGDVHELGHGLEKGRFRFTGWEGHSTTNPYSYFTKYNYYLDTGKEPSCQSLPFKALFDTLKASQTQADPVAYMQAQGLTGWSQGVAMTIQMMMAGQNQGSLNNGWYLLARLHILERDFYNATRSEEKWTAMKANLGFASYSYADAKVISNNDWMNIATSVALQKDMRAFLAMWGLPASDTANNQIAGLSLPAMAKVFYAAEGSNFCKGLDKTPVTVNSAMVWPSVP
ncbi:ImpA family metalloprotease [Pseudomonas sp. HK3]